MFRPGSRGRGLVALGGVLARRGAMAKIALVLAAVCIGGFSGFALLFARRGRVEALQAVPLGASSVLAVVAFVLLALAGSARAFRRDARDGIAALVRARGVDEGSYVWGRVMGLAVTLSWVVAGGSALVGLIAILGARAPVTAFRTGQATLAAVAFGIAFAVTLAPVTLATLGGRSRAGGLVALLVVLVLPELAFPTLARALSPRWAEVCSIPRALLTLRDSLAPGGLDPRAFMRAIASLSFVVVAALVIIRSKLGRSYGSSLR